MNERDRAGTSADAVSIVFRSPFQGARQPQFGLRAILRHANTLLIWLRKCGRVLTVCCPEGTNERSQAIYCLETHSIEDPSRRARSDPYSGLINRPHGGAPVGPNHTVPYGTVPVFAPKPGNKLPGYFHNVPTGQRHLTPVHEFGATSLRVARFEDQYEAPCASLALATPLHYSVTPLLHWFLACSPHHDLTTLP
jgi:hypothetical protein